MATTQPWVASRIEGTLSAGAVLARFVERDRGLFAPAQADAAGRIERLLAHEADLSAQWRGLPGTDHPRHWRVDAGDEAASRHHRSAHRRLDVHLPMWWALPLRPALAGEQAIALPLAHRRADLEALVRRHLPGDWFDGRIEALLDVETRTYWGAQGADPNKPAVACACRSDRVVGGLSLFRLSQGEVVAGTLDDGDLQPQVTLHLRPGTGWLVAQPVLRLEREPRRSQRWRLRMGAWWRAVLARLGYHGPVDRDPTYAARLRADERWWQERLATPAPAPEPQALARELAAAARVGASLRPASRPAAQRTPAGGHLVVIHGGLSSVRAGFGAALADADGPQRTDARSAPLWPGLPLADALCTWRFEHDTFLSVRHNVARLVSEIERACVRGGHPGTPRHVVLLAHSRGGNVARFALAPLRRRLGRRGWTFAALTLGSPHLGTDVFARVGARWHGMAALVGGLRHLGAPWLTRDDLATLVNLERGLAYEVPRGFHDVEPQGVARMARGQPRRLPEGLWLVGSHWGPEAGVEGRAWDFLVEDLLGAEDESDGLVGIDSALAGRAARVARAGQPREVDGHVAYDATPVFHTQYLAHAPTRAVVAAMLADALRWRPGAARRTAADQASV